MFDWEDLLVAFALYLILEGLMPFLSPPAFRSFVQRLSALPDNSIRNTGLVVMLIGVALLYFVR
ncbi:MAG: DUF2065 domain-containing protein [Gammaproteobacteria bacterium]|nr:DUF2065 domain-containing protein [Gammaproteobacteria bacterium]MYD76386.1 DUF2065 domain-containing protein [Gammaproteobacteria bacterium]MYJ52957.1 DUF2065 domain-containing protein [Gammaproteobacteria bacterium]